jgi:hypothetical protein
MQAFVIPPERGAKKSSSKRSRYRFRVLRLLICQDRLGTQTSKENLSGNRPRPVIISCFLFRFPCFVFRAGGALLYYPMQPNGQISEQTLQVRYISIIALFS